MASNEHDPGEPLLDVPPAEFVAARTKLAAELKQAGKKAEAAAVKALPKPAASVWLVNQLARRHRAEMARFLATSDEVRRAQLAGGADEATRAAYKRGLAAQREALDRLLVLAAEIAESTQLAGGRATVDRAANDLRWGALDDARRAELGAGRLRGDVEPPDFSALVGKVPPGGGPARVSHEPPTSVHGRKPANDQEADDDENEEEPADKAALRAAKQDAESRVRTLRADQRAAEARAERTRQKANTAEAVRKRAEARIEELRDQLAAAEDAVTKARQTEKETNTELAREDAEVSHIANELKTAEDDLKSALTALETANKGKTRRK